MPGAEGGCPVFLLNYNGLYQIAPGRFEALSGGSTFSEAGLQPPHPARSMPWHRRRRTTHAPASCSADAWAAAVAGAAHSDRSPPSARRRRGRPRSARCPLQQRPKHRPSRKRARASSAVANATACSSPDAGAGGRSPVGREAGSEKVDTPPERASNLPGATGYNLLSFKKKCPGGLPARRGCRATACPAPKTLSKRPALVRVCN